MVGSKTAPPVVSIISIMQKSDCGKRITSEVDRLLPHHPLHVRDRMRYHTEEAFGDLFPTDSDRLYLAFIYPLISPVALLIKQPRHVVGITTLMGADDQS